MDYKLQKLIGKKEAEIDDMDKRMCNLLNDMTTEEIFFFLKEIEKLEEDYLICEKASNLFCERINFDWKYHHPRGGLYWDIGVLKLTSFLTFGEFMEAFQKRYGKSDDVNRSKKQRKK